MAIERATQRLVRAVRPQLVEVPKRESVLRVALEEQLTAPLQPDWDRLLALREVDTLWSYCAWAGKESLLALSVLALQPEDVNEAHPLPVAPMALQQGRGTAALIREVRQCPKQMRAGGGTKTSVLAAYTPRREHFDPCRSKCNPLNGWPTGCGGGGGGTSHS